MEPHAHWTNGHFPVRFAQLAEGYVSLGYDVDVLTAFGWSDAGATPDVPFAVHSCGVTAQAVLRAAWRLGRLGTSARTRRWFHRSAQAVSTVAVTLAARAHRRQMSPPPDATVLLAWGFDSVLAASIAGPGTWLVNEFEEPSAPRQPAGWFMEPVVRNAARRAERRRHARGGRFQIASAKDSWTAEWKEHVPFLHPLTLPIAGARMLPRTHEAPQVLGLPSGQRVALMFGSDEAKHIDTVLEAFEGLEGWTLVVAGEIADRVVDAASVGPGVVLFPGRVDNATRDLLLAAATLMVLSFVRGYWRNSGTLMDAISIGVPVVCSAESAAAEIVTRYRLGPLFDPGDAASLSKAVGRAPERVSSDDLDRARRDYANGNIALRQLVALEAAPPSLLPPP